MEQSKKHRFSCRHTGNKTDLLMIERFNSIRNTIMSSLLELTGACGSSGLFQGLGDFSVHSVELDMDGITVLSQS